MTDYADTAGARVEFEGVIALDDTGFSIDLRDCEDCPDDAEDDAAGSKAPEAQDAALSDDVLAVGPVPDPDPTPDLGSMTLDEREWWSEHLHGFLTYEQQAARRNYRKDWDAANRRTIGSAVEDPDQNAAAVQRTGWDDVPLDVILDAVSAGTFTLPLPTVGMLADGSAGLLYPGRVNGLAGESGAGKGWIALTIAAEQMRLGRHAYYLDFEDSPALVVLRLVMVLRIAPQLVRDRMHYVHPSSHDAEGIQALVDRVAETPDAFVVIDSTGESIASAGLNQNHDEDVARWMQDLAHPLADRGGACVLLIDHMVKSEDGGLWPIGSQRKRASITGTQLVAEVAVPFSKTADGMVALKVAKDRHGAREARSVASYVQFVHPATATTTTTGVQIVQSDELRVVFGSGKTGAQVQADKATRATQALDADVATLVGLTPAPTSYRDVKVRLGWKDERAQAAMREWKSRSKS